MTGSTPGDFTLGFILPVGISFYTFQTMSYTIDLYRNKTASTDRFLDFAAYVAFFPQLVAGPIERASSDFAIEVLDGLSSIFVADHSAETKRMQAMLQDPKL